MTTCFFCDCPMPPDGPEEGWEPGFHVGAGNDGPWRGEPVCPRCVAAHLKLDADHELFLPLE
jgi:hypothetical protein